MCGLLGRMVGAQAVGPGLHREMVDDETGVHVGERLLGQAVALFLLGDPGGERLLHDPAARAFQPRGHLIDLFRERERVSGSGTLPSRFV